MKLSIGMPVYNAEKYLRESLESLLNQETTGLGFPLEIEIIISDNCSIDRTQDICLEYVRKHPNIKYIRNNENLGPIQNFNNVFYMTSGDFFMWASYDDIFRQSYIKKCLSLLVKSPMAALAGTWNQGEFVDHGLNASGPAPYARYAVTKKWLCAGQSNNGLFYGIYRRSVLDQAMPLEAIVGTDTLLTLKISLLGEIITFPEILFIKRPGGDSGKNIAKVCKITNPFYIHCWMLTMECYLQAFLLKCRIDWAQKTKIRAFTLVHYTYLLMRYYYWKIQKKI